MRKRILALDFGQKRIGVALSDELGITAQGQPTIEVKSIHDALTRIKLFIGNYNISRIVIGLPKNMDGSLGPKSQETIRFSEILGMQTDIPITMWDERLTTKMAEQSMLEGDLSRSKRKSRIDMISAQLILQSYLDSIQKKDENNETKTS
jgi:putative holliday junction resolvase